MPRNIIWLLFLMVLAAGVYFYWNFSSRSAKVNETAMEKEDGSKAEPADDIIRDNKRDMTDDNPALLWITQPEYYGSTKGYYARPNDSGEYPGIVMIHEWWGLNGNIERMARELAQEGYLVLAVDLFGSVAETSEEARAQVGEINQEDAVKNLRSAADFLRSQGATKVGSLGWCFGGGQSLQLALSGEKLDATVIYYGQLTDDQTKLSAISWPVLGIFGGQDASIPESSVNSFKNALDQLRVANEIVVYPGVGHAFANPSGDNYAGAEAEDAWQRTESFLETNLKE